MIRFLLDIICVGLFLLVGIPISFVLFLIGKKNKPAKDRIALSMVQWIFKVMIWVSGTKLTVKGRENIPDDEPVLYVANHRSFFDIIIGYTQVKGLCGFVSKKEMIKAPLLSHWMKLLYCLFLDRDNIKEGLKTILEGIDHIKNKRVSVWIFPEGTRNRTPEEGLLPFREGAMKIAEKSGCAVIPVAIYNTDDIFEKHFPIVKPQPVTFTFGEPIYLKDLDKEQRKHAGAYVANIIEGMLKECEQASSEEA